MPEPSPTVRLGTRGSALALAQADLVTTALTASKPGLRVERVVVRTTGDKRQDLRLGDPASGADKGVFTKELEEALLLGEVDLAVHSLKDVPTRMPKGLVLAGTLERAAVEDVLVVAEGGVHGLGDLAEGAVVGTSSVRRRFQIIRHRPDLRVQALRGNVPTRLEKLVAGKGGLQAIVLARAGLDRLGLGPVDGRIEHVGHVFPTVVLDPKIMLPAASQGAIGLQIRENDEAQQERCAGITPRGDWTRVRCEREFLRLLDAGCHTPIGVMTRILEDGLLKAKTVVFSEDGTSCREAEAEGRADEPESVAEDLFRQLS